MAGVGGSNFQQHEMSLAGQRVFLAGKLASMPRRDAEQLIREYGGQAVDQTGELPNVIVVAEGADPKSITADQRLFDEQSRERIANGQIELVRESEFWARLGLVDSGHGVN